MNRLAAFALGTTPFVALLAVGGCAALDQPPMDNQAIEEYRKLADAPAADAGAVDAGLQRWKDLLSEFSVDNIRGKVAAVYADNTFFNDTLKTLHTPAEIEDYLLETAEMLKFGKVEYDDVIQKEGEAYVRWKMTYRSKKLRSDEDIVTIGMSHLIFDDDGKVIAHQDFWDSTRGIFEHVPVLGAGIRMIKKRL